MGKHDETFAKGARHGNGFVFDESVAEVFEDMCNRSIPFYSEQQNMIGEMARRLCPTGTNVYDLGCSTATTLIKLHRLLGGQGGFVGYDNSEPMLERARENLRRAGLESQVQLRAVDLNDEIADIDLCGAGIVTMCWTLQFVRPLHRERLIRLIHDSLVDGGALVVAEKVLARNPSINRTFIDCYYDMKRRNGYSDTEIARKRQSLENVLVPYTIQENLELLARNGFHCCETFFQWHNFAGFVAVKESR